MSSDIEHRLRERGITLDNIITAMRQFSVETPSWSYGDSGTRFKVFHWPGAATTLREKMDDVAQCSASPASVRAWPSTSLGTR